jgi:dTDP-4-dehydrorhamnose reductase
MKVLVLGGMGMLGHKVWQVFCPIFDTWVTVRMNRKNCRRFPFFNPTKIIDNINGNDFESLRVAIEEVQPDVVVNCIGIVKKLKESESAIQAITINALLPHWLEDLSVKNGFRIIQISTDCVFSGKRGNYEENDLTDPYDLYGRTKLLGEIVGNNSLTIRTSVIGRELQRAIGLLEWFLSQKGTKIQGYKYAIFSGFTTKVLADILANIIAEYPNLSGLYHISSQPISKLELLSLIKDILHLDVEIEPYEGLFCDRSLNSSRFLTLTHYQPPSWEEMINELSNEVEDYNEWRT